MDEVDIIRALQQGVTAAVAASDDATLPVSYLDVAFNVPADQKYLEIVHVPNNRQGDFWGSAKRYRGILRLVLHWPKNAGGLYSPLTLLGSIGDYFYKGRVLSGVEIYEIPDYTGAVREGGETLYPISIWYQSLRD